MSASMFAMGKYGPYVWPSVAIVLAILCWNAWSASQKLSAARQRARRALAAKDTGAT